MPIGDLLAQITGEQSTATSTTTANPPRADSLAAKRKPNDDLRRDVSKTPRQGTPPQRPTQVFRPTSDRPPTSHRSAAGNGLKAGLSSSNKPATAVSRPSKPSAVGRPSPLPAATSAAPKAPPKKGSFAEILARGQRAQAVMGQVGKIQHKKVEKGAVKIKDEAKPATQLKRKATSGYTGSSKAAPRNGANGHGPTKRDPGDGVTSRSKPSAAKGRAEEEVAVKAVKKAALATTGYTGTARPKPVDPSRKRDAPRGGALLNAPKIRHGSSKRSRYEDDYDEELDDFIEYDEDEDEGGPRYGYASDGSSDMEAGMDELDVEERRAEYLARREDIEEERLEKTLKAAKEDRKRKALAVLRAGKRS